MPLNSDEVNYLIYRYLVESGFDHSAFVFLSETAIHDRCIGGQHVERGALIRFLHKGLQYQNFEYHITKNGSNKKCSAPFHFFKKHICSKSPSLGENERDLADHTRLSNKKQKVNISQKKSPETTTTPLENNNFPTQQKNQHTPKKFPLDTTISGPVPTVAPLVVSQDKSDFRNVSKPSPSPIITSKISNAPIIPDIHITILKGTSDTPTNTTKVLQCSWNPTDPLTIALGKDATVCIWKVSMDPMIFEPQLHVNLRHDTDQDNSQETIVEVNSLQWAPNGALIATGTSEGSTWLWSRSGVRIFHARKHLGPVLSMEWNTRGSIVATASLDRKIILWDSATFSATQQIEIYETPILSLDWLNEQIFAVSSLNPIVYIFKTGKNYPLFRFSHSADVNKVSWSKNNNTLVSCSDDSTLKFWHLSNNDSCLWTATGHENKINTCQWCPTRDLNIVASAASDGTVRIWDVSRKKCLYVLEHTYQDVSCLNFSPDGKLLATCTEDGIVNVWSVDNGQAISTFDAKIQIFDTKWNGTGRKLALTLSNSTVAVIDFPP